MTKQSTTRGESAQSTKPNLVRAGDHEKLGGWSYGEIMSGYIDEPGFPFPVDSSEFSPRNWIWDVNELNAWLEIDNARKAPAREEKVRMLNRLSRYAKRLAKLRKPPRSRSHKPASEDDFG